MNQRQSPSAVRCSNVIYAKDARRLAEFYRRTLALATLEATPAFVLLGDDAMVLTIVQAPEAIAAQITIEDPPVRREDTPIKCSFLVDDLTRVRAEAAATGGGTLPLARAWDWQGQRHLDGHDPEGNVLQFRALLAEADGPQA
ncbi:MAG TPA: VOC family protein [Ideonella sp.]|uniref:VOC family protein n=1 Tax=Ideonella sp. TaxID=1929293 RepID=UPI002B9B3179|nr:VOC family protein [Ideonella sp.]HSI47743.1 VOC family protein [Ideonella sp.]